MAPPAPFLFGKLPAHGDFVARGLGDGARQAWDDWATEALERLRRAYDDFEAAHEAAPPWRFVTGPAALGPGWRAGALAPSIDGAGRRFVLSLGVDGLSPAEAAGWGDRLAEASEAVLYRALAEGLSADAVVQALALDLDGLTTPEDGAAAPPADGGVWWSVDTGLAARAGALPPADLLVHMPQDPPESAA